MDFKDLVEFISRALLGTRKEKIARLTISPSLHQGEVGWVGFFKGYKFWILSDNQLLIRCITDEELKAQDAHTLAPKPPHSGQDLLFPPFRQHE